MKGSEGGYQGVAGERGAETGGLGWRLCGFLQEKSLIHALFY